VLQILICSAHQAKNTSREQIGGCKYIYPSDEANRSLCAKYPTQSISGTKARHGANASPKTCNKICNTEPRKGTKKATQGGFQFVLVFMLIGENPITYVVRPTGFEPVTPAFGGLWPSYKKQLVI